MVAQRLPLLWRKLHGTIRLRGIEPYMQEYFSLNTKQHPILTISLFFRSPQQGQRIFTNFFDIHCLMMLRAVLKIRFRSQADTDTCCFGRLLHLSFRTDLKKAVEHFFRAGARHGPCNWVWPLRPLRHCGMMTSTPPCSWILCWDKAGGRPIVGSSLGILSFPSRGGVHSCRAPFGSAPLPSCVLGIPLSSICRRSDSPTGSARSA